MKDHSAPHAIRLTDYQPPHYWVDRIDMQVSLGEETHVRSVMNVQRDQRYRGGDLILNGVNIDLRSLEMNGEHLDKSRYSIDGDLMTIRSVPERAEIIVQNIIRPFENTSLEGLYVSNNMYCTQCEAEGFRKITYYPDRPDVMAKFTVRLEADKASCPVLLCNGNLLKSGDGPDGKHWVLWEDPFPKPSYLFAMVGGQLSVVEDHYITRSGRNVKLQLFVEPADVSKCDHAMRSLKNAMKWDEDVYGREYDLDLYMIVAVSHFNMGAMENKGLNIFNSSCVLAEKDVTTDAAFQRVEGIIAHEYFHNWSGNRVTCRDWFQLSLKEGFTVFRDQEFSADMNSRPVKRIEDVNILRTSQFPEDAGPMAHPVRPEEYIEINNFYTVTIYEKGAEVVRMIHHLVGAEGFRKGTDLYFERHDGQAVTTDDFVRAMEDANAIDLTQFKRWYSQAGTPQIAVHDEYHPDKKQYSITLTQSCPPTPKQPEKLPFHIPIAFGLIGSAGELLPPNTVLQLTEATQRFTFENIAERPVPSILRGFSAPVKVVHAMSDADLLRLMAQDSDGFNRWDSAQKLATRLITGLTKNTSATIDTDYLSALGGIAQNTDLDPAIRADLLTLPTVSYLMEQLEAANPVAIYVAAEALRKAIVSANKEAFLHLYAQLNTNEAYEPTAAAIGRRSLKNVLLGYLAMLPEGAALVKTQWASANNMTDRYASARAWVHQSIAGYEDLIHEFYERYQHESLVMNMWLSLQATQPVEGLLPKLNQLLAHPTFEITNPNRVRSLIGALAGQNPYVFHQASGAGYEWLADHIIKLNAINPQIAARLVNPFTRWRRIDPTLGRLMKVQLERIAGTDRLSPNVFEIVTKTLAE